MVLPTSVAHCKPFCKKNQLEAVFIAGASGQDQHGKPFCKKNQLEAA